MRVQLNDVVQEFIVSNGKIAHSYFSLSEKIIDSLCDSNIEKESILMRVLEQAETVTAHYFNAHQQVLEGVYANGVEAPVNRSLPVLEPVHSNPVVLASAPVAQQTPALSYGQWLRAEISSVTGFKKEQIDFDQSFESLGIDSWGWSIFSNPWLSTSRKRKNSPRRSLMRPRLPSCWHGLKPIRRHLPWISKYGYLSNWRISPVLRLTRSTRSKAMKAWAWTPWCNWISRKRSSLCGRNSRPTALSWSTPSFHRKQSH